MKYTKLLITFASVWLMFCPAFGQSPPNDNFANRIVLTGTDITFIGTLTGATLEDFQEATNYNARFSNLPATESVWWEWTAPATTTLTLQVLGSSTDQDRNSDAPNSHALAIYYATNGSSSPSGLVLPPLGFQLIDFRLAPISLSIPVIAGSNYQIQLIGNTSDSYTMRLVASNAPVIIQPPKSRTVYSNASIFFYVISAGVSQSTFTYQWYFNGTNLPGATAPMLELANIDGNMAGNYFVVVSNSFAGTTSQVATLSVSQSNVPATLTPLGTRSNSFRFSLAGESGRLYRIQSSTNLLDWSGEQSFPFDPFWPNTTSIILSTNSVTGLTVSNAVRQKFFRALPYVIQKPDADICITHLAEIRIAKILWARDSNARVVSSPTIGNIQQYFPNHALPVCPDDLNISFETSYRINELLTYPICEIHFEDHLLEQPQ